MPARITPVAENNLVAARGVHPAALLAESLFGGPLAVVDSFLGGRFHGCWVVGVGLLNLPTGFGHGGGGGAVTTAAG